MNQKQNLQALFAGKKTEKLAWTTIADDSTRMSMTEDFRDCSIIEFYRKIGCDIIQFGNHGLREEEQVRYPFSYNFVGVQKKSEVLQDGSIKKILTTPKGELVTILKESHPVRYPVETGEQLRILLEMWGNADVVETPNYSTEHFGIAEAIGDDGLFVPTLTASPIQQLLEYDMGVANFYFLLADHPQEMDALIREMHRCKLKEYEFTARNMPFEIIIPIENTSTAMISPDVFRKYSMEHLSDFTQTMHRYGKKSIIHMCGHIGKLLNEIREIRLDGIHALTEPPVGDCFFEKALDVLGDDTIIIGTLDSTIFQSQSATADDIEAELERIYTPRIRNSRFVLWPVSDGLPTELWRFEAVREWMETRGS